MQLNHYFISPFIVVALVATSACNSPMQSQKFFIKAVNDDPVLEPIHQTALYTVFFDHALRRCVLHSSYTWGESGGGTGGTGLGVTVFNCNPQALKAHVQNLRQQVDDGTDYFELPVPKMRKSTTPKRQNITPQRIPHAPKPSVDAPTLGPEPRTPSAAPPVEPPTPGKTNALPSSIPPLTVKTESPIPATTVSQDAPKAPPKSAPLQPIYQP